MPMKTSQTVGMSTRGSDLEASGDSPTGSDFGFTDDENDYSYDDDDDDDDEDYEEFSGSGDTGGSWRKTLCGVILSIKFVRLKEGSASFPRNKHAYRGHETS